MSLFEFPLHFLRPWWWLALLPLPLVLWLALRAGGGARALARLADAALLPHLMHGTGARRRVAVGLVAVAWLLAVAALAGPAWQKVPAPLYVNGASRVVVLSLSDHMLAEDLKPDRMTRARFAVRDLLAAAGDARTALVAYAGAAFTVAPLTVDTHTVENLLRALSPDVMPVPGNDAAAGIRRALGLLQDAHAEGGEIVLVTDTAGPGAVEAARAAQAHGVRVDVLGIGTTAGAPVPQRGGGFASGPGGTRMARRDDAALRAVAQAGGGRYAVLRPDGSGVTALAAPRVEAGHVTSDERAQLWRDGGAWLLPLLVVVAALAFRRGWLMVLALLVLPPVMSPARAASWESLWANRDQRALQALQQGDPRKAQAIAASPGVRGAADYRAGDFAGAATAFSKGQDARAHYNQGNALARLGKYPEAVAAYQQALQRDPDLADARANLAAVEAWMRKHPPRQAQGSRSHRGNGQTGRADDKSGANPSSGSGQGSRQSDSDQGAVPPSSSTQDGAGTDSSAGPQGQRGTGARGEPRKGASPGEDARQRQQAAQARQGLQQELGHTQGNGAARESSAQSGFALGQSDNSEDSGFNAQQRALLHAVPDDPGALLRRKFQLEWQQRQAQPAEGGS